MVQTTAMQTQLAFIWDRGTLFRNAFCVLKTHRFQNGPRHFETEILKTPTRFKTVRFETATRFETDRFEMAGRFENGELRKTQGTAPNDRP